MRRFEHQAGEGLQSAHPVPKPGISRRKRSADEAFSSFDAPRNASNLLYLQSQHHNEWLFGGIAELIHNSSDANAKHIKIRHSVDPTHDNQDVLEIWDDGDGMSPEQVSGRLMQFGNDGDPMLRDQTKSGRYGVGFKQGSMRVRDTAVFVTKPATGDTVTIGILCNRPFKELNERFLSMHATLSSKTFRCHPEWTKPAEYQATTEAMEKWSFLNRERIMFEVKSRFTKDNSSGTVIFIQHWNKERNDYLEVEMGAHDMVLYKNDIHELYEDDQGAGEPRKHEFRRNCREGNVEDDVVVAIDCSLREYLSYMFYEPRMKIVLLGKTVEVKEIRKELTDVRTVQLLPSFRYKKLTDAKTSVASAGLVAGAAAAGKAGEQGGEASFPPLSGIIGKCKKWEQERIGGAMLYGSNCLITSFLRPELGLTYGQGWGVVLVVHCPLGRSPPLGRGIETLQTKQGFEGSVAYNTLQQAMRRAFQDYLLNQAVRVDSETLTTGPMVEWAQCDSCQKWRQIDRATWRLFQGDRQFFCYLPESPIMQELLRSGYSNSDSTRRMACTKKSQENDAEAAVTLSLSSGAAWGACAETSANAGAATGSSGDGATESGRSWMRDAHVVVTREAADELAISMHAQAKKGISELLYSSSPSSSKSNSRNSASSAPTASNATGADQRRALPSIGKGTSVRAAAAKEGGGKLARYLFHAFDEGDVLQFSWDGSVECLTRKRPSPTPTSSSSSSSISPSSAAAVTAVRASATALGIAGSASHSDDHGANGDTSSNGDALLSGDHLCENLFTHIHNRHTNASTTLQALSATSAVDDDGGSDSVVDSRVFRSPYFSCTRELDVALYLAYHQHLTLPGAPKYPICVINRTKLRLKGGESEFDMTSESSQEEYLHSHGLLTESGEQWTAEAWRGSKVAKGAIGASEVVLRLDRIPIDAITLLNPFAGWEIDKESHVGTAKKQLLPQVMFGLSRFTQQFNELWETKESQKALTREMNVGSTENKYILRSVFQMSSMVPQWMADGVRNVLRALQALRSRNGSSSSADSSGRIEAVESAWYQLLDTPEWNSFSGNGREIWLQLLPPIEKYSTELYLSRTWPSFDAFRTQLEERCHDELPDDRNQPLLPALPSAAKQTLPDTSSNTDGAPALTSNTNDAHSSAPSAPSADNLLAAVTTTTHTTVSENFAIPTATTTTTAMDGARSTVPRTEEIVEQIGRTDRTREEAIVVAGCIQSLDENHLPPAQILASAAATSDRIGEGVSMIVQERESRESGESGDSEGSVGTETIVLDRTMDDHEMDVEDCQQEGTAQLSSVSEKSTEIGQVNAQEHVFLKVERGLGKPLLNSSERIPCGAIRSVGNPSASDVISRTASAIDTKDVKDFLAVHQKSFSYSASSNDSTNPSTEPSNGSDQLLTAPAAADSSANHPNRNYELPSVVVSTAEALVQNEHGLLKKEAQNLGNNGDNKQRHTRWSEEEKSELIKFVECNKTAADDAAKIDSLGLRKRTRIDGTRVIDWDGIAKLLGEKFSAEQCKQKWKNINKQSAFRMLRGTDLGRVGFVTHDVIVLDGAESEDDKI